MDQGSEPGSGQYSYIESLLRALHQPMLNTRRPDEHTIEAHPRPNVLGNIEEQAEESSATSISGEEENPESPRSVEFEVDYVSESSNPPTPGASSPNFEAIDPSKSDQEKREEAAGDSLHQGRNRETNLERFNKNVINVMDTLMKSQLTTPMSLSPSASTGKPFAFYHRMHRHNSAHSLNIPNIIVTGSSGGGTDEHQHVHHHHKRFSFGLRRHSHAVVGTRRRSGITWITSCFRVGCALY